AVLLARMLGPGHYGVYSFSLAIVTLCGIPAQVGIPQITLRETAKTHARLDWSLMAGLWRWSNKIVAILSVITIFLAFALLFVIGDSANVERQSTFLLSLLLIPLIGLANVRSC